jgi:predicted Zn-dependent peptidase
VRLLRKLGASDLSDGRENAWGVPAFAEGDPSLYAIIFSVPAAPAPSVAVETVRGSLLEIRREAMSDAEIRQAAARLADFYDNWLLEPDYRILSDHLAALAFRGDDPREVRDLSARIRQVSPSAVRRVMDRALLPQKPLVVVLGGA